MLFRVLFPIAILVTALLWVLDIPPNLKRLGLLVSAVVMVLSGVIFFSLTFIRGGVDRYPQVATPIPTPLPAATRPPEGPGFESACKTFRALYRDVESGLLLNSEARAVRFQELRENAAFRGVPEYFTSNIEAYASILDELYGQGAYSGTVPDDVELIERSLRRTRDEILSECRAHLF